MPTASETDRIDLDLISEAAREAGALALDFFRKAPRRWNKADDTVVTEADIAVDRLLMEKLRTARPAYGWLSEEHPDDGSRLKAVRAFIVDPIDGTRAFVDGGDEWVVSIGIAAGEHPVAGVLCNPVRDELWTARAGGGAWRNGERLAVSDTAGLASARIAASRKAAAEAGLDDAAFVPDRRFLKSLAHRLARVAAGETDAALATSDSADWDLAAALLLVREAGGVVTDMYGEPVRLNQLSTKHPAFVAAGPRLHAAILEAAVRSEAIVKAED
ncbi:3'(2'),5'-bisphosphate nucleotidase CysQ [Microbaculum marinum]|uniref:3'(2'),5'-bisphosphate nucleotidase CysQ n=1 Tax=Microbaculum marinum TaxID=1764581 RepID=A0AAW9RLB1_9HYPH